MLLREFGTVAKGMWQVCIHLRYHVVHSLINYSTVIQGSGGGTTVAVKMLNSTSDGDRVRFLQEGAIMGQFRHDNIVALCGLVLKGEPVSKRKPRSTDLFETKVCCVLI